MAPTPTPKDLGAILMDLHNDPVEYPDEETLQTIYSHLMGVGPSADGVVHWFCSQAEPVTKASAAFLFRLLAYDSDQVSAWKVKLRTCLASCTECVEAFGEAKVSSRHSYFGKFNPDVLERFFARFNDWEIELVLESLVEAGVLLSDSSSSAPLKSLSQAPSSVVFHMVSNLHILKDPRILSIFHSAPPVEPFPGWPTDPPAPGILILMLDENAAIRHWAKSHASKCVNVPIQLPQFTGAYSTALGIVAGTLTSDSHDQESTALPMTALAQFSPVSNPVDLWTGFSAVLRLVPPNYLTSSTHFNVDIRRIITGHLHDTGPHFASILRCLIFLLKRMGREFWLGEGPEFSQIVFDSIKDNPAFSELLLNVDATSERPWFLSWFAEYLYTIHDIPAYCEVLVRMADFMCEELQHERFQDSRPLVMIAVTRLLSSVLRKSHSDDTSRQRDAVSNILDIHIDTFVTVAFRYSDSKWKNARNGALDLVTQALLRDVQSLSVAIKKLCSLLAGHDATVELPKVKKQIWKRSYESLQSNDANGVVAIINVVAQSAHLDALTKKAFAKVGSAASTRNPLEFPDKAVTAVNDGLMIVRDGFIDALSKYANYNTSSTVLDILRQPGVVRDMMALMLSPVEDIQVAAKTLVGLAFDVDVRLDCFRALLENVPDAALEGLFKFMGTFLSYAPSVPEACSLAKSLVRCLTDIIEVLCASHDGLLHNERFLRPKDKQGPGSQMPKLWHLMTQCITIIFKRTPLWSVYFENEEMIVWMRDALIFGRDMLAQRRVIEVAASTAAGESSSASAHPGKLSAVGRKMVNDLQDLLPELARWLRLTDEELLHQSFSLLQSLLDCFRESYIPPSAVGLAKLNRHVEDARKKKPDRPETRLDSTRLAKLEAALATFDDDVEIVSHTLPPKKVESKKVEAVKVKAKTTHVALPQPYVSDLRKPSASKPLLSRPVVAKPAGTKFFTTRDQQRLDSASSVATFRKSTKQPTAGTSKQSTTTAFADRSGSRSGGSSRSTPGDESEDESEDELQGGLAALQKVQRSPKAKKPAERRQIKMLDVSNRPNPMLERLRQQEEARRRTLRMRADISGLHRALLSWNYEHDGPQPPTFDSKTRLAYIPDRFSDYSHYRDVLEPLLLLECWSQILQSKEEPQDSYTCKIMSRQFIDDWIDLDVMIPDSVRKDWYLAETDVVLLRLGPKSVLAKTKSYRATPHAVTATLRVFANNDAGLQINTAWQLSKVFSLSTLHREYAALVALQYYDFSEQILQPRLSKNVQLAPRDIKAAMDAHNVNEPQATAILGSLRTEGFSLIQGPPGTGKTSTICGLVDAFLASRPRPSVTITAGRNATAQEKAPRKKILLCAPSNAAIDEVAHRISRGLGKRAYVPNVVRVGADKAINISAKDISLDFLVDQKLDSNKLPSKEPGNELASLRAEIEAVKRSKQQKVDELATVHDNAPRVLALQEEIQKLNMRRTALSRQCDSLKDQQKSESRTMDALRRKVRADILNEADVICSTLSGAGHDILEPYDFEMVIIDEAAQAIELSSLIPLKYSCRSCVMVGDPQQLPPTVISLEASKFQYNQSLFVRLQKQKPDAVYLLSIQYRMHPQISQLPSRVFYQGRLTDGPDMDKKTQQPWHSHQKFGVYRFYNVSQGREETGNSNSFKNKAECNIAIALYSRLRQEFSAIDFDFRIGIVSMYRAQIFELRRAFEQRYGREILGRIDFNTVDGFQGQEKDVIILSCVRAGPGVQSVGFLADTRRMNVALTRARSSLFILGNAATLERSNDVWRSIVSDARTRSCMIDVDNGYFTAPNRPQSNSRVALPSKPSKAPPPPISHAIPTDLVTPKAFVASENRADVKPTLPAHIPSNTVHESKPAADMTDSKDTIHNRQNEGDRVVSNPTIPSTTSGLSREDNLPNVRPKPAKRPKKEANIFIPKGNKRPPPDGNPGPSNIRRRLA